MSTPHAVIIGGSSGIGLASAQLLLKQNFEVSIAGRDRARLSAANDTLKGAAAVVEMDACSSEQVREGFARIGRFDHLILALGSRRGLGPFVSVDIDEVRQGFEEKVIAHFACAQAAIPHLNRQGSITLISAVSAHAAMPGTAGIGAANAAVAALVPILAAELKPLRVNAVSPGVIDTPWWDFLPADQKQGALAGFAAKTPLGRNGTPQDVAQAVGFLVCDTFVTGQTIICDGGVSLASG
jgi:NAD(P)-dependent dehydrogenase (short-subunit alcohol dehydrogenase family)